MDCAFQLIPQAPASVLDLLLHHNNNVDDDGVTHLSSVDKGRDISHRSHHQLLLLLDTKENTEDVLCGISSGKDQQANELRASCFLHVAGLLVRSSRISLGAETGSQLLPPPSCSDTTFSESTERPIYRVLSIHQHT